MMQEDMTQHRVVMRGAMDSCCNQWAPILPPADVLTRVAIPARLDSGDASPRRTDSDSPDSTRK